MATWWCCGRWPRWSRRWQWSRRTSPADSDVRLLPPRHEIVEEREVFVDHAIRREVVVDGRTARGAIDQVDPRDGLGHVGFVAAQEPGVAVGDDLGRGSCREGQDR